MPQGDRTGPNGQGPMTGRAMGYCAGFNAPGFVNQGAGFGRGFARGFGRGRGFGRRMIVMPQPQVMVPQSVQMTEAEEKQILETDLADLKAEMKEIEKRLKELSTK